MSLQEVSKVRIKIFMFILLLGFPCIMLRLFILQVVDHFEYHELAIRNLDRFREITPRRGNIYDRNGILLASTSPSYNISYELKKVLLNPDSDNEEIVFNEESLKNLHCLIEKHHPNRLTIETMKKKIQAGYDFARKKIKKNLLKEQELAQKRPAKYKRKKREYEEDYFCRKNLLEKNLSQKFAHEFLLHSTEFDHTKNPVKLISPYQGFLLQYSTTRKYPQNNAASQLLGGLSGLEGFSQRRIEYLKKNFDYRDSDEIGNYGIESSLEQVLRGRRGYVVQSPQGSFIEDAVDGLNVELTIDIEAQKVAEQALTDEIERIKKQDQYIIASQDLENPIKETDNIGGAAVVIDIETGEILVMASAPCYNNDELRRDYKNLIENKSKPLANRAIVRVMDSPPGSVFKVCVALYALEYGFIKKDDTFLCEKYLIKNNPKSPACTHHHGVTNVVKAIEGSCNIFFYNVGRRMGHEELVKCASIFGFDRKSGLNFLEESRPELPPKTTKPGEHQMFGIGQIIQATSLQVARAMACIVRKGDLPTLKIVRRFRNNDSAEPVILQNLSNFYSFNNENSATKKFSDDNYNTVLDGMVKVTTGHDGTALKVGRELGLIKIASKTGTSQVQNFKRDHAWFAGFAPYNKPKYAFAVFIELGGAGGPDAGPVAVKILKHLFKNENAKEGRT